MRCFSALEADGSAPLVQAKTSGQNVAFSTCYSLFILVLFNRFMVLVQIVLVLVPWYLYLLFMVLVPVILYSYLFSLIDSWF